VPGFCNSVGGGGFLTCHLGDGCGGEYRCGRPTDKQSIKMWPSSHMPHACSVCPWPQPIHHRWLWQNHTGRLSLSPISSRYQCLIHR